MDYPESIAHARERAIALEAEIARLRAALEPFAKRAAAYDDMAEPISDGWNGMVLVGDLRRAREVLQRVGTFSGTLAQDK
jgi:hypothetical protein